MLESQRFRAVGEGRGVILTHRYGVRSLRQRLQLREWNTRCNVFYWSRRQCSLTKSVAERRWYGQCIKTSVGHAQYKLAEIECLQPLYHSGLQGGTSIFQAPPMDALSDFDLGNFVDTWSSLSDLCSVTAAIVLLGDPLSLGCAGAMSGHASNNLVEFSRRQTIKLARKNVKNRLKH